MLSSNTRVLAQRRLRIEQHAGHVVCWKSGSASQRMGQKRRRPKSRFDRPDHRGLTVREKQRLLVETNQRQHKSYVKQGKDLIDVAKGRLGWVRHRLYSYWNPHYDKIELDSTNPSRKFGASPVMDTRWWIWNILFAMAPAMYIGLYCEFRARPRMHEFHRQQQLVQMRGLMGEEWYEENARKVVEEKEEQRSFLERFADSTLELYDQLVKYCFDEPKTDVDGQPVAETTAVVEETEKTEQSKPASTSDNSEPETPEQLDAATVKKLLARIEELERHVKKEKEEEIMADFQPKSGIRKRLDENLMRVWGEKVEEHQKLEESEEPQSFTEKIGAMWLGLTDSINSPADEPPVELDKPTENESKKAAPQESTHVRVSEKVNVPLPIKDEAVKSVEGHDSAMKESDKKSGSSWWSVRWPRSD